MIVHVVFWVSASLALVCVGWAGGMAWAGRGRPGDDDGEDYYDDEPDAGYGAADPADGRDDPDGPVLAAVPGRVLARAELPPVPGDEWEPAPGDRISRWTRPAAARSSVTRPISASVDRFIRAMNAETDAYCAKLAADVERFAADLLGPFRGGVRGRLA